MKIPDAFSKLFKKTEDGKEYYFSLYIDTHLAAVAVWHPDVQGSVHIDSFAHGAVSQDSWEARVAVLDRLMSAAEEKVQTKRPISKTVFGLPASYLTADGNIADEIRPALKKLTNMLDLTPLGFVPLTQALVYALKQDEGVPPSIIFVGGDHANARVSVYRVGKMTGDRSVDLGEDPAGSLEHILKEEQDGDVLPSRIFLYGGSESDLEHTRTAFLKHPWTSRVNFIHYPKISIVSFEMLLRAISLAGSAEISPDFLKSTDVSETAVIAQPTYTEHARSLDPDEDESEEEIEPPEKDIDDEPVLTENEEEEEIANVEMVSPAALGFQDRDIIEQPTTDAIPSEQNVHTGNHTAAWRGIKFPFHFRFPFFVLRIPTRIRKFQMQNIFRSRKKSMVIFGSIIGILGIALLGYSIPRATVTVLVSPKNIEKSTILTVDAALTAVDTQKKVIPGNMLSQSISGEKTIAVTGTKNIGDPAKGTVTLYNKVTAQKTLKKGSIIVGNGIKFSLDEDVSIASASETIGSITFGKATIPVTAEEIGPNGNIQAGVEFSVEDVHSSQVTARNESAFTGGTSKQVTVVSRADQDALVKELTDELVEKAKSQLTDLASGGEQLIADTIDTKITKRIFNAEINEEASKLTGSLTVTVSGLTIRNDDVEMLMTTLIGNEVPEGYAISSQDTDVQVSDISLNKDDTVTLTATYISSALPDIDKEGLKKRIAGKDVQTALDILREGKGVAGAEYDFALPFLQNRLPFNRNNITLTVKVQ